MLIIKKRRLLIYLPLLFIMILVGQHYKSKAAAIIKTKEKPPKTVLIFEKKPCYGFCPVYKATFQKEGKVTVNYTQPGKPAATTSFNLTPKEICDLYSKGEKAGFFKMKPRYETLKTDTPERELTLYKKNKPKSVVYYEGGSPEFEAYLTELAAIIENKINVNFGPPENN